MSRPPTSGGHQIRHARSLAFDLKTSSVPHRTTSSAYGSRRDGLSHIHEPAPSVVFGVDNSRNIALRARRSQGGLHHAQRETRRTLRPQQSSSSVMSPMLSTPSRISQSARSQYSDSTLSRYSHSTTSTIYQRPPPRPQDCPPSHPTVPEASNAAVTTYCESILEQIQSMILLFNGIRSSIAGGEFGRLSFTDTKRCALRFTKSLQEYLRQINSLPEPYSSSKEAQVLITRINDLCTLLKDTSDNSTLANITHIALADSVELMDDLLHYILQNKPLPDIPASKNASERSSVDDGPTTSVDTNAPGRPPNASQTHDPVLRVSLPPSKHVALEGVGSLARVTSIYDPLFDKRTVAGVRDWVAGKLPKQLELSGDGKDDSTTPGNANPDMPPLARTEGAADDKVRLLESLRNTHALVEAIAPDIARRRRADTRSINYVPGSSLIKAIDEDSLTLLLCSPTVELIQRATVLRLRSWFWPAECFCSALMRVFTGELVDPKLRNRSLQKRRLDVMTLVDIWVSNFLNQTTVVEDKKGLINMLTNIQKYGGELRTKSTQLLFTVGRLKTEQKLNATAPGLPRLHAYESDEDVIIRQSIVSNNEENDRRLRIMFGLAKDIGPALESVGTRSSYDSSSAESSSANSGSTGRTSFQSSDGDSGHSANIKSSKESDSSPRIIRVPDTLKLGDNDWIREFANQLTLYESRLFCGMNAEHLARFMLYKDDKVCGLTKKILRCQQLFLQHLEAWVKAEYFCQTSPSERASVFTAFVQLASRLFGLRNFSASQVITNTLLGLHIYQAHGPDWVDVKLPLTYKYLNKDVLDRLQDLETFFVSFAKHWKNLKADTRPLVPLLSNTLRKYVQIQEVFAEEVKSSVDDKVFLINLSRYRSCYETMTEMEDLQRPYDIPWNEKLQKSIRKTFEAVDTTILKKDMKPYRTVLIEDEKKMLADPNYIVVVRSTIDKFQKNVAARAQKLLGCNGKLKRSDSTKGSAV